MSSTSFTRNDSATVEKSTNLSICPAVVSVTETQTLETASSSLLHSSKPPICAKNKKHQRGARGKKGRNVKRSRSQGSDGDNKIKNEDEVYLDVPSDSKWFRAIDPLKDSPRSEAARDIGHICSRTEQPSKPSMNESILATSPQILPTRSLRFVVESSEISRVGAGSNEVGSFTFSSRSPYQSEAVTPRHTCNSSSYSAKRKKKRRNRNNEIVGDHHPRGDAERTGKSSVSKDEMKKYSKPSKTARALRTAHSKQSSTQVSLSHQALPTMSGWYCEYCDVRTTESLFQHNVTLVHLRNVDYFQKNVLQPMIESCAQRTATNTTPLVVQSDSKALHRGSSRVEYDNLRNSCLGVSHVGTHVHNPAPVPPKGLECDRGAAAREEFVTTPSLSFVLRSSLPCVSDAQPPVGLHLSGLVQRPTLKSYCFTLNGFPLPPPIVEVRPVEHSTPHGRLQEMAESAGDVSVTSLETILADSDQDVAWWEWEGSAFNAGSDTLFSFLRRQGEPTSLGLRSAAAVGLFNTTVPNDTDRYSLFHVNLSPSMPYPSVVSRKDTQSWRRIASDVQSSYVQKVQPQNVLL